MSSTRFPEGDEGRRQARSAGGSDRPSRAEQGLLARAGKRFLDFFWALDSVFSTVLYEVRVALHKGWAAWGSFLERFRIEGFFKRRAVDLIDDGLTFALAMAFVLVAFALPPITDDGDIWNRNRQYAVTITDSKGEIIGHRGIRQDDAVPLSEIPPHLIKAVLATEDARFYHHFGVDVIGTLRAAFANVKAQGIVQGGSTLTQQLAKNLFLTPERSFRRKIHEAFLALWIEARLSKDEILKMYLDRSYLGAGNYGVEAASQFYFGKSVRDINIREAAILAGLFKAPSKYAPHLNRDAALARADIVLRRMLDAEFISYGEYMQALKMPVHVVGDRNEYRPNHFLDWVYRETIDILRVHGLEDNYVVEVKTTIDTALQRKASGLIAAALKREGRRYNASQGALVALTPDGAVRAIVGGRDYESSQFNRATDAWRQPGSAFKPFVYLAALMNGWRPDSLISDAPITIGGWTPQNYSRRYHGRVTLTTALVHSYNTVPVRLMVRIGKQAIIDVARAAGLRSPIRPVSSMPLGSNEVTVLDITAAYAAFANGGQRVTPYTVLEIRRPDGMLIYSRKTQGPRPEQTLPPEKVRQLNRMLALVPERGTARRAYLGFTPQAGKTGTTSRYRDAWYIGYTGHLVTGIWFGNDDYSSTNRMTGGSLPAQTWKAFMIAAIGREKPKPLPGVPVTEKHMEAWKKLQKELQENRPGGEETPAAEGAAMAETAARDGEADIAALSDSDILMGTAAAVATATATKAARRHLRGTTRRRAEVQRSQGTRRKIRRARRDPVVSALSNMFSLFRADDRGTRRIYRNYQRRQAGRQRKARRNARRARKFWNIFR
jgi:penicillin-binding protein 1A